MNPGWEKGALSLWGTATNRPHLVHLTGIADMSETRLYHCLAAQPTRGEYLSGREGGSDCGPHRLTTAQSGASRRYRSRGDLTVSKLPMKVLLLAASDEALDE